MKERIRQIEKTLPEGVVIEPFLDRTKMVNSALGTVATNLMEGALIVVFVLVLFLGNFRAGLLVASVRIFGPWRTAVEIPMRKKRKREEPAELRARGNRMTENSLTEHDGLRIATEVAIQKPRLLKVIMTALSCRRHGHAAVTRRP